MPQLPCRKLFLLLPCLLLLFSQIAFATPEKPTIAADESSYSEETSRYHLKGNVVITSKGRVAEMDEAEVSQSQLEIWGYGSIRLTEEKHELAFTADAIYLEGFAPSATLFGRVILQRPGLVVRAESATCDWTNERVTFRGAVIAIENGKERVAETLVYDIERGELRSEPIPPEK